MLADVDRHKGVISIHALLAESDAKQLGLGACQAISIHALLAESDGKLTSASGLAVVFLSTLSLRRATPRRRRCTAFRTYFYPRSPCGERLCGACGSGANRGISIHALLAESDRIVCQWTPHRAISIHALLAESDISRGRGRGHRQGISIHALLAESDNRKSPHNAGGGLFLSTLSLRRATG